MTAEAFWVMSGPGLPCGARRTEVMGGAPHGRVWLDVCILGQHLPQMYSAAEIRELTSEGCARLGLCPDCLGFGDLGQAASILALARRSDEAAERCPGCGGSGRPALRVTVRRDASGIQGAIQPLPHEYVSPLPGADSAFMALFEASPDMCLACGMPPDGTGPRGEVLHPEAA